MSDPLGLLSFKKEAPNDPLGLLGSSPVASKVQQVVDQNNPEAIRQAKLDSPNADSLLMQGVKSTGQSLLGLPAALARTVGKVYKPASEVADSLDRYIAELTPIQSGANPNAEALIQTAGTLLGETAANVVGFEGAKLAVQGTGLVAKLAAPELASKALATISKAGRATELLTGQFVNARDAARLGNAVIALPTNVAAGLGLQAAVDPASLSTPSGLAKGFAFSALGALMEAKGNDRSIGRKPKTIDPDLPEANQRAQAAIQQEADVSVVDLRQAKQNFRTNFLDRLNPVKVFSDVVLGNTSLYDAVQLLVNGSNSRIDGMLKHGTRGMPELTNQSAGMKEILGSLSPKEAAEGGHLDQYLLAMRRLDEHIIEKENAQLNTGKPPRTIVPLSIEDAQQIVANAPQHIIDAADGMMGFMNSVKEYGIRNGVLRQEVVDAMDAKSPNYVPLQREVERIMDPALRPIDNTFGPGKVLQRMFGSGKDVLSPTNNIRDFATRVIRTADRNGVGYELLNSVDHNPAAAELMGVRRITGADKYNNPRFWEQAGELKDRLANEGVNISDDLSLQLIGQFGKNFDPVTNILTVQTANGLERLQLNGDLAKMYKSLAPKQLNFLQQMLAVPARTLRTGVTAALDFSLANIIRDTWDATLQGEYGFKSGRDSWTTLIPKVAQTLKNTGRGFAESIKDGQVRAEFLSSGAGHGEVTRIGNVNPHNVFEGIRPLTVGQKLGNIILHPIDALKEVAKPFEEATRIGEFISNREHGASLQEAGLAARRVTTDFSQVGMSMQALSQMTSFMNPAIQSLDRNWQTFMSDKTGMAAKGIATISLPSIALWFANRNDKQINDLRKTPAGATYWFVRAGDHIMRVPKPFLYGQVFGTTWETTLDKLADKDPQSLERLGQSIFDQATFNVIPNAFSVPLQMRMNKDIYTGGDIIPDSMKGMDPQSQVSLGTSQLAQHVSSFLYKATGGTINVSPIQLDWVAKNTGGNIARDISNITGEKSTLSDYPFFRRFVAQYPSMNVEPIQTFYHNAEKFNGVVHTVDKMAKSGADPEKINAYLEKHSMEYGYASAYAETQKQLRDIQQTIWQVHSAPDTAFDKEQKKRMITQMTETAIELVRGINSSISY